MSEIKTRVITAAVLAAVFCTILVLANWIVFFKFVLVYLLSVGLMLSSKEYYACAITPGEKTSSISAYIKGGIITVAALMLVVFFHVQGAISFSQYLCLSFVSALALLAMTFCDGKNDLLVVQKELSLLVPSVALLVFGGYSLIFIGTHPYGSELLFWLIAVVSVNDAAAYFVGSEFGKIRLAPALSPKKTVLGSVAGFVCGVVLGAVLGRILGFPGGMVQGATLGVVTVFCGQLGDLLKSYAKRTHGIKDFGTLFPGHGGMLDRADGYLAAAPLVALYLVTVFSRHY